MTRSSERFQMAMAAVLSTVAVAEAQTTSIRQRVVPAAAAPTAGQPAPAERPAASLPLNAGTNPVPVYGALQRTSMIAVTLPPPKAFKVHDLITIIVREQHQFKSDGDLEQTNKYEVMSELDAFVKFVSGGVGASDFRRGKPNINYKLDMTKEDEGQKNRKDSLTTRLTAEIIDVKPNGNLVLAASKQIAYDEETSTLTLTGVCRSTDVTPDNTILSTQVADMSVKVDNQGAVNDATKRGWFTKFFGKVKPF